MMSGSEVVQTSNVDSLKWLLVFLPVNTLGRWDWCLLAKIFFCKNVFFFVLIGFLLSLSKGAESYKDSLLPT